MFIRAACLRPYQEGSHQSADFGKMHFDAEMPKVEELHLGLDRSRLYASAPYGTLSRRKQWRLPLSEITLEVGAVGPHSFDNSGSDRACRARPACPRKLVKRLATEELGRHCAGIACV